MQKQYKLEVKYVENPNQSLNGKENSYPDLIVGEGLASRESLEKFDSVNDILNNRINSSLFYKDLLGAGMQGGTHKLLPINFNLPAIIFKPENIQSPFSGMQITLDDIKENSQKFRQETGTHYSKFGFSPVWNRAFIYYALIAMGLDIKWEKNNQISWNQAVARNAISYFTNWIKTSDKTFHTELELEEEFQKKYITIPEYQLLQSDRILFSYMDIREFLRAPPEKVERLDFRWLAINNKIPVLDDILFSGVCSRGRNKKGAKEFLIWFFQPDIQNQLLDVNHVKRLRGVFGLANGFSALKEINEKELHKPQKYPLFVGHIPQEEQLLFPGFFVKDMAGFKKQLVDELLAAIKQQKSEFYLTVPGKP